MNSDNTNTRSSMYSICRLVLIFKFLPLFSTKFSVRRNSTKHKVSKIIQYNFIKLLRLCGSIFFINIFPYFKVFTSKFFGHNIYTNTFCYQWKLGEFIKINFFSKFHFLKTDLFLKINSKLLLVADAWL